MHGSTVGIGGNWTNGHAELRRSWWLIAGVGCIAVVLATPGIDRLDWGAVAIMTALGLGTGVFAFPIGQGGYVSFSRAVFVASLALFGIPVAVWVVATTTALLNGLCFRRRPRFVMADVGVQVIAAGAAGFTYALVGGRFLPMSMTFADAGRCFLMFLVYGAVSSLMQTFVNATKRSPFSEYVRWVAGRGVVVELAMLPLALLLVASYTPGEPATFPLLAIVLMVSSAAGKALWDAREAVLKRVGELRTLNAVAQELSDARHCDDIIGALRSHATDLVGARKVTLALTDGDGGLLTSYASESGAAVPAVRTSRPPTALEAWVMREGLPLVAPDEFASCLDAWSVDLEHRPTTGSWAGVPLKRGRKLLGVLSASRSDGGDFLVHDAELLAALGNQVSRVVDNVRLTEKLEESKAALERWNRTLEERVEERTRELEHARAELEDLNEDLERRVEERTAQLESMYARMVEAGRLSAVGELAAGIAHELNNPLGGILGYAQYDIERLMARGGAGLTSTDSQDVVRHLRHIERETQRCKRIVENLVRFSAGARCAFSKVDVNEVLEQTLECTERQLAVRGIELDVSLDRALPPVVGDPQELQQVFANIILNARGAMSDGGRLSIRTSVDGGGDGQVAVRFEDSGRGMEHEQALRMFEPFSAGQCSTGPGLGLSVSYGIVKQHGGVIDVESEPGAGSAFTVRLPTAAAGRA